MKKFVTFQDPDDDSRLIYLNLLELNYALYENQMGAYWLVDTTKENESQTALFEGPVGSVIFFAFTTPESDELDDPQLSSYWNKLWRTAVESPYTDVVVPLFPGTDPDDIDIDGFSTEPTPQTR